MLLRSLVLLFVAADLGPVSLWNSFETAADLARITPHTAAISRTSQNVTDGQSALLVDFGVATWPNILFDLSTQPQDWRAFGGLAVDVFNPEDQDLGLSVRIDDDVTANGSAPHSLSGQVAVPAHSAATVLLPFGAPAPMLMGMRFAARLPGALTISNSTPIDFSHITAFQFFLTRPTQPHRLFFDNLRLLKGDMQSLLYSAIADPYGQFTKESWPGKVTADSEFDKSVPGAPPVGWDEYGGLATGPRVPATGFFRAWQQPDGTWWLVTPGGHLFFSLGVDSTRMDTGATYVEGREWMFTGLPAANGPLASSYGTANSQASTPGSLVRGFDHGRTFNFYSANLQRKYGQGYQTIWRQTALDRLRAWGFNTIGNWSDSALFTATDSRNRRMPYVVAASYGSNFAHVRTPADYWGPLPDPFDPQFATAVDSGLRSLLLADRDDPFLLGYFVENELSWAVGRNSSKDNERFSLAYGVLGAGAESPAKQAWVQSIEKQYRDIAGLNRAWATAFASWSDLLANPYTPPASLTSPMRADFSAFVKTYAERYFQTIGGVIHKYDPNHLYLGSRFSSFALEQVQACAEYCDVISFNIYARTVDPAAWSFLNGIGKPAIIGEFHFGALDRGMFGPGLVPVPTEEARGQAYADYFHSVITNPNFVGAHWFQYADEPLTGRLNDGENYAIGLVSVADTPYPELTGAARAANEQAYATRLGPERHGRPSHRP